MSKEYFVGRLGDVPPGGRKIVTIGGREIGIFNVRGHFYALRNICPHQGAPLCLGDTGGTLLPSRPGEYIPGRDGEILRCPWHAWEFDLLTGRNLTDPGLRVKSFDVTVKDGGIYLHY